MKGFNFYLSFTAFLFLSILSSISLSGQESLVNEPLAIEYFKAGNFEKALPLFTELFKKSPDNAMYNYYYGVTLLKNNHYETATKEALLNAVVDDTPSDVNFYLGNYFQALGNWGEALDFYARYKGSSQERKSLEFDKYLNLCRNKVNPFVVNEDKKKKVFVDTIKTPASRPDEKSFPIPEALRSEWFNFQVHNLIIYHSINDFRSEAARILFTKAWLATARYDSIVAASDVLRKTHENTNDVTKRLALVQQIVGAEQQSYQLLLDRDKYFEQARVKESAYWDKAGENAISDFMNENATHEKAHDSLLTVEKQQAEKKMEEKAAAAANEKAAAVASEMQAEKAKEQAAVNENVLFKVQIGSFLHGKITPSFKALYNKLSKLHKIDEYMDAKKFKIFTIGNTTNYTVASTLKDQLKLEGVKGAFVVAYKNGEKIPVTDVIKIKPGK
jgi:tetratricopeptide (TPR) repeat protein